MQNEAKFDIIVEKLSEQGLILGRITVALESLAIQHEQVTTLTSRVAWLSKQHDILVNPKDGIITDMKNFQASCPRKSFKWALAVIVPLSLAVLGLGFRLLTV